MRRSVVVSIVLGARIAAAEPPPPSFGVMADVGLPDGATASLVYRPVNAVRFHAGLGYNLVSPGVRAGLTLVPFKAWLNPTLTVDVGHFTDGDANPLARRISGDPTFSSAVLDRVGYDYANAHLGLEFGRKWFTFYVHAGMSRVTGSVHELSAVTSMSTVTFTTDPNVTVWSVSARAGFIVYFLK
jgi:hypothetical protein